MLSLLIGVGLLGGLASVLIFVLIAEGPALRRDVQRVCAWARGLLHDPPSYPVSVGATDEETASRVRSELARMRARQVLSNVQPVDPIVAHQIQEAMKRTNVVPFRAVGTSERTMKVEIH